MAQWMRFTADVDYQHKSRAVTAYKAGMVEYLPQHIADSPQLVDKAEPAEKPVRGEIE